MRKITVLSMISLDGVMQAPGGPEEDPSEGFTLGGWVAPYRDDAGSKVVQKELQQPVEYLLGRKTFQIWEGYWPKHAAVWPGINTCTKYVLSGSITESEWENTVFIKNADDIKALKHAAGPDIQVWGSSRLIQLLFQHDLVDEIRLKIYPVILGKGKKLFDASSIPAAFTLTESLSTQSGVVIASYMRAAEVKTGNAGE